jgi:hypothetical protein
MAISPTTDASTPRLSGRLDRWLDRATNLAVLTNCGHFSLVLLLGATTSDQLCLQRSLL